MLVSSGAIVVLTAAADPWIWMVMATSLVAVVWLAVTHLGAQWQRATRWLSRRSRRDASTDPPAPDDPSAPEVSGGETVEHDARGDLPWPGR